MAGDPDDRTDAVRTLTARGKVRGHITIAELEAALPAAITSSQQIEDFMTELSELGINVIEHGTDTDRTLKEIDEVLAKALTPEMFRERIRQIEAKSLRRLERLDPLNDKVVPIGLAVDLNKVSRALRDLRKELRRDPAPDELATRLHIPVEKLQRLLKLLE